MIDGIAFVCQKKQTFFTREFVQVPLKPFDTDFPKLMTTECFGFKPFPIDAAISQIDPCRLKSSKLIATECAVQGQEKIKAFNWGSVFCQNFQVFKADIEVLKLLTLNF